MTLEHGKSKNNTNIDTLNKYPQLIKATWNKKKKLETFHTHWSPRHLTALVSQQTHLPREQNTELRSNSHTQVTQSLINVLRTHND